MSLSLPEFFNWDGEAVKFVSTPDGGMDVIGFPVGKPVRWVKYLAPISRDATPISEEAFNKIESEVKNMNTISKKENPKLKVGSLEWEDQVWEDGLYRAVQRLKTEEEQSQ